MLAGQRCTWPKLHMIENRMRIEVQIELGRDDSRIHRTRPTISREPTSNDLDSEEEDGDRNLPFPVESISREGQALDHVAEKQEIEEARIKGKKKSIEINIQNEEGDGEESDSTTKPERAQRRQAALSMLGLREVPVTMKATKRRVSTSDLQNGKGKRVSFVGEMNEKGLKSGVMSPETTDWEGGTETD